MGHILGFWYLKLGIGSARLGGYTFAKGSPLFFFCMIEVNKVRRHDRRRLCEEWKQKKSKEKQRKKNQTKNIKKRKTKEKSQ